MAAKMCTTNGIIGILLRIFDYIVCILCSLLITDYLKFNLIAAIETRFANYSPVASLCTKCDTNKIKVAIDKKTTFGEQLCNAYQTRIAVKFITRSKSITQNNSSVLQLNS